MFTVSIEGKTHAGDCEKPNPRTTGHGTVTLEMRADIGDPSLSTAPGSEVLNTERTRNFWSKFIGGTAG